MQLRYYRAPLLINNWDGTIRSWVNQLIGDENRSDGIKVVSVKKSDVPKMNFNNKTNTLQKY